MSDGQHGFSELDFRQVLGHYPTGVVIVTACVRHENIGMVVGTFTSVSLDPPLIAFLPMVNSRTFAKLRQAQSFCVNVLSANQEQLCRQFASQAEDKFAAVSWHAGRNGAPILEGAVATIECDFEQIIPAGDHFIALGRVVDLEVQTAELPLLFFQGGYGRFTPRSLRAVPDPALMRTLQGSDVIRQDVDAVAAVLGLECTVVAHIGDELALVATSNHSTEPGSTLLGARFPLVAPLGSVFVDPNDVLELQRWLSPFARQDEVLLDDIRARFDRAHDRGWSLNLAGTPMRDWNGALGAYSSDARTPDHERHFIELLSRRSELYEPATIQPEGRYNVVSIVVALTGDAYGHLGLRLSRFAPGESGAALLNIIDTLVHSAEEMSEKLLAPVEPTALV